jgi:hypothetical protein
VQRFSIVWGISAMDFRRAGGELTEVRVKVVRPREVMVTAMPIDAVAVL